MFMAFVWWCVLCANEIIAQFQFTSTSALIMMQHDRIHDVHLFRLIPKNGSEKNASQRRHDERI